MSSYEDGESDEGHIVIDNGSSMFRAGFAGDDAPRVAFPSMVGRPRSIIDGMMDVYGLRDVYVGDEAQAKRGILSLKYPIEKGIVTNWDDMELLLHHTFHNELRVAPEEHAVMCTEKPMNPKANRETMTQIMFETFMVDSFHLSLQAVLSYVRARAQTYSTSAAVVVDSGSDVTHVVPIYEGYALPHAIMSVDIGGSHLTHYMEKLLEERGYAFSTPLKLDTLIDLKKKLSYVALDFFQEFSSKSASLVKEYELPCGQAISLEKERFQCAEVLFGPDLIGKGYEKIQNIIHDSIIKCDDEIQGQFYSNIILAGGNTLFPGFGERMQKEMSDLISGKKPVKVSSPPERELSAWIGGSILASLGSFQDMWVTKVEYDECGPGMVHKKCV